MKSMTIDNDEKIILIDVDGVMLNWVSGFLYWAEKQGYRHVEGGENHYFVTDKFGIDSDEADELVRIHNSSPNIGNLPPIPGAPHYMEKLYKEHGYMFHVISSFSKDKRTHGARSSNIARHFNPNMFIEYSYLEEASPKDSILERYSNTGCFWIEDHVPNANAGLKYGLTPLLLAQDHSNSAMNELSDDVMVLTSWREIFDTIVSS